MSLKGDYNLYGPENVEFFMNEVATRGGIVSFSTVGSGAALDQSAALVTYAASASGNKPVGVLVCDMVNLDLTRQHLNQHKNEVQKGGKVQIASRGWFVTNNIANGLTIGAGDPAYLTSNGNVTNVNAGSVATPLVGRFLSKADEDGYAKVEINLP